MSKGLYRFEAEYPRRGTLHGLFVATSKEVAALVNTEIHFGAVFEKHSDIYLDFDETHLELLTTDIKMVNALVRAAGGSTICGVNPLEYATLPSPEEPVGVEDYSDGFVVT